MKVAARAPTTVVFWRVCVPTVLAEGRLRPLALCQAAKTQVEKRLSYGLKKQRTEPRITTATGKEGAREGKPQVVSINSTQVSC